MSRVGLRLFYTRPQWQIINNNYLSKIIDIRKRIKQGSLFILSIKFLENFLKS